MKRKPLEIKDFMDLSENGLVLKCFYHGRYRGSMRYLACRIISVVSSTSLKVAVSLWPKDVDRFEYDPHTQSLNVFYDPQYRKEFRIDGLIFTNFTVPNDIRQINIYDKGREA